VDAVGEPTQLLDGSLEIGLSGAKKAAHLRRPFLDQAACVLELQRDGRELLLRAIVEIALDRPARGIRGTGDSSP
jgi:hypothetical protein